MRILAARPLADRAITLELDTQVGHRAAERVRAAGNALDAAALAGVSEISRSFTTVTVHYDPLHTSHAALVNAIEALLAGIEAEAATPGRLWHLPCCYAPEFAPDLADLSARLGLPEGEIVARHAATEFDVYAIGFLPGLPFLGELAPGLSLPRRQTPRPSVPAGSVAIAGGLCVIYPWESPGGWHILGRCPVPLFDAARPQPALLAAGDRVRFTPIGIDDFTRLRQSFDAGTARAEDLLQDEATS